MTSQAVLTTEMWEMILTKLPVKDRLKMSLVSRRMNRILNNPYLWTDVKNLNKQKIQEKGITFKICGVAASFCEATFHVQIRNSRVHKGNNKKNTRKRNRIQDLRRGGVILRGDIP